MTDSNGPTQIENDFNAYNKTGDTTLVQKYSAEDVDHFIKRAYEVDNTPSLMAARAGAIRYRRTLCPQRPPPGRLARLLRALLLFTLVAGLLLAAASFLARR